MNVLMTASQCIIHDIIHSKVKLLYRFAARQENCFIDQKGWLSGGDLNTERMKSLLRYPDRKNQPFVQ